MACILDDAVAAYLSGRVTHGRRSVGLDARVAAASSARRLITNPFPPQRLLNLEHNDYRAVTAHAFNAHCL